MKLLGILRASALFILVSAFHGPRGIFCSNLEVNPSNESFTVEVSDVSEKPMDSNVNTGDGSEGDLAAQVKMLQEKLQALEAGLDKAPKEPSTDNMAESMVESPLVEEAEDSTVMSQDAVPEDRKKLHGFSDFSNEFNSEYEEKEPIKEAEKSNEEHEQHDVARKTETDVTSYPSTINLSDGSKNPDGSMATPSSNGAAEDMEAEQEERLKEMQEISEDLKDSPVESQKSIPSSQSDFVFENSEWDDSMLASAVLFLEEFCKDVKTKKFSGKIPNDIYEDLSKKCEYVSSYVGSFIHYFKPTYGTSRLTERNEIPMDLYEGILKPEDFKDYVKWLKENIQNIIKSFKNMYEESKGLTEKELTKSDSMGPLKYGFVYNGDGWKQWIQGMEIPLPRWIRNYYVDLKGVTSDIISSLESLHSQLKRVL
ncbi:secreted antigen 3 [Babesia divergens]|uniref:Secreted antigen 3 n=1 Tax=Babesia divergens TaxID=32595 RepID=A0AAD9LJH4_BABDI|nr:secreted antigen 3 [Babesia divergens]